MIRFDTECKAYFFIQIFKSKNRTFSNNIKNYRMNTHFKDINIGLLIKQRVNELETDPHRICNFLQCNESEMEAMFLQKDLPTDIVLRWSKLLKFDFFRIYSQHLILYSPPARALEVQSSNQSIKSPGLPEFRKNIYTVEVIEFILELIRTGKKTRHDIIHDYHIPKTTLHRWLNKYADK